MTCQARVVVDPDSFERTKFGGVVGKIYLDINGVPFPGQEWDDFVLVILGWWLQALESLRANQQSALDFMDGPYLVAATMDSLGALRLEPITRRSVGRTSTQGVCTVDLKSFVESVRQAAHIAVRECRRRGWKSSDLDSVQYLLRTR